LTAIKIK